MTLADYNRILRKLRWPHGLVLFGAMIPGLAGALYLTDRLAASSSWNREYVFLAMLPAMMAPIMIAVLLTEFVDKRIGLSCTCGQSLTCGRHVKRLMREGGTCPACGKTVVEPGTTAGQ